MDQRYHQVLIRAGAPLLLIIFLAGSGPLYAGLLGERLQQLFSGEATPDPAGELLPVEEAFRFSAAPAGADRLELFWQIADGYYLYHDKFAFRIIAGEASIIEDGIRIPPGTLKQDDNFGDVEVNTGATTVSVPLQRRAPAGRDIPLVLQVTFQGCKEDEVCYPPVSRQVSLTLNATDG